MADEFGSGIFLDEQFDFSVGSTGDLKSTNGLNELQKDLAFKMVLNLEQFLGQPPSGNLEAKVADVASRVAVADVRVNSVVEDSIDVQFNETRDELTVKLAVRTDDGEQNLIFDV